MDYYTFDTIKLARFVTFARAQDVSILLVRQEAYSLLLQAEDDVNGDIRLPATFVDKAYAFLRLDENMLGTQGTVSMYAFQKHLSQFKSALRNRGLPTQSGVTGIFPGGPAPGGGSGAGSVAGAAPP